MSFALATNTSLLLMDEPTNGLDIPGKSQFRKFLASGMSDDKTIVISTHQVRVRYPEKLSNFFGKNCLADTTSYGRMPYANMPATQPKPS